MCQPLIKFNLSLFHHILWLSIPFLSYITDPFQLYMDLLISLTALQINAVL